MKIPNYFISITILLLGLQSFAQNEKISIGIKLLPGISNSNQKLYITSFKPSIGGGAQFIANFNKVIGIESGLYFRNYGYSLDETITDEDGYAFMNSRSRHNYNYLSLPVLLRLNINSFYFSVGTNIDFLISATRNIQGTWPQGDQIPKDIENTKMVVIEPSFNCGYQFVINDKFGINLEGGYSFTVNGILEGTNDIKLFNLTFGFGFCYFIVPKEK